MRKIVALFIIFTIFLPPISSKGIDEHIESVRQYSYQTNGTNIEIETNEEVRSTWIWHAEDITTKKDQLLTFLTSQNITRVYIQIHPSISFTKYKHILEELNDRNIEVYALDGAPDWVHSTDPVKNVIKWIEEFHFYTKGKVTFNGFQLDVEPYLLAEWKVNKSETVKKYQQLIREANKELKHLTITLEVAIPFWFDKVETDDTTLAEWVIQNTDSSVIMAYRDKASGNNGIIALSENEVALAQKYNKKITIAVETRKEEEYPHVSFYEEGTTEMEKVLEEVRVHFKKLQIPISIAIHDYVKWKKLLGNYAAEN